MVPCQTADLRRKLRRIDGCPKFTKKELNRCLYDMQDRKILESGCGDWPLPLWRLAKRNSYYIDDNKHENSDDHRPTQILMVDCNNCPQAFKKAADSASRRVRVLGFASPQYNAWKPSQAAAPNCVLWQAREQMKEGVTIEMAVRLTQVAMGAAHEKKNIFVLLVSRNKAIKTLAECIGRTFGEFVEVEVICKEKDVWEDLKHFLN